MGGCMSTSRTPASVSASQIRLQLDVAAPAAAGEPQRAQRGEPVAASIRAVHEGQVMTIIPPLQQKLIRLLAQLKRTPTETAQLRAFMRDHGYDLKCAMVGGCGYSELRTAAQARNVDLVLMLLDLLAGPANQMHLGVGMLPYNNLLNQDVLYDLNGDELDDEAVAARLQVLRDVHMVQLPRSECMSIATVGCVVSDRLECLRFMLEVDPMACGYTQTGHDSLLHLAAAHCKPRIVTFLLESGWSAHSHDLNRQGHSPLDACMFAVDDADPEALCTVASMIVADAADAAALVRSSRMCDYQLSSAAATLGNRGKYTMLPSPRIRMLVYVCAALNAHHSLPTRVLTSTHIAAYALLHSPGILRTLPLDEHIASAGGMYLNDNLRLGSVKMRPVVSNGVHSIEHHDPAASLQFAVAVDALCVVEGIITRNDSRLFKHGVSTCMSAFRFHNETCEIARRGASTTLRHWAWMRRKHAVNAHRNTHRKNGA